METCEDAAETRAVKKYENAAELRARLGGISEPKLDALLKNGFPQPIRLGRQRLWVPAIVDAYMRSLGEQQQAAAGGAK